MRVIHSWLVDCLVEDCFCIYYLMDFETKSLRLPCKLKTWFNHEMKSALKRLCWLCALSFFLFSFATYRIISYLDFRWLLFLFALSLSFSFNLSELIAILFNPCSTLMLLHLHGLNCQPFLWFQNPRKKSEIEKEKEKTYTIVFHIHDTHIWSLRTINSSWTNEWI